MRDALQLMIAAYTELGMDDLAHDTQRVLAYNENTGALIEDPLELGEKPLSQEIWEFFELDEN